MSAAECFKAGKLNDAIEAQAREVKAKPLDAGRRLFLFELLACAGDLDRARRQLDAIPSADPDHHAAVSLYRGLLDSEIARRAAFHEGRAIAFLTEVPDHVRHRLDAVRLWANSDQMGEVGRLLNQAREAMPNLQVLLNGTPRDGIVDGSELFGTVIEVMANGQYYWVPLEHVSTLAMNEPKSPRDLLWIPARLELTDGQTGAVFLPALYPDSHLHPDDDVRLGRATGWQSQDGGPDVGSGQKTFLAGDDLVGILEWRALSVQEP